MKTQIQDDVQEETKTGSDNDPNTTFELGTRYSMLYILGTGATSCVTAADDNKFQEVRSSVAVKKMSGVLADPPLWEHVLREVILLRFFQHENVLNLVDIFSASQDVILCYLLMFC
jgi:serine/threonine protein kinase